MSHGAVTQQCCWDSFSDVCSVFNQLNYQFFSIMFLITLNSLWCVVYYDSKTTPLLCKMKDMGDCLIGAKPPNQRGLFTITVSKPAAKHSVSSTQTIVMWSISSKDSVLVTRPWSSFFFHTVEVMLHLFFSTCKRDVRAKLVSEPGNIWVGFLRAGVGGNR